MTRGADQQHRRGTQGAPTYNKSERIEQQRHINKIKNNRNDAHAAFSGQVGSRRAPAPILIPGMRVRDVLLLREVLDAWRHETFRRWPAPVTDLSILKEQLDIWHAWVKWVRLATGLGKSRAKVVLRTHLCEMLGCDGFGF